ncbi:rab effector MyRIP-like isoform X2 [Pantherophis guttatus]|uniref:Rab effector MyRIP isoform X2 n=1 Tax=Pantherophis guttatus TaxID=94885 RepID=A0ABM3Z0S5_PANGU|nr:rab effector MyRIP isoform X2 [Pantherophis guttatus]XP_060541964.1 rab effector MyRIP-like isoform X2 [Pantherophis guttatus]
MRRKLDLSDLTDDEAEHLIQVVQRDFSLRKKEEDRLNEMKQKLDEEGNKCSILSKHERFNEHCCMCCCSPFNFLINTKRQCQDCKYNICKNCSFYQKKEKAWLCNMCQQARLLRAQSLEWYYNNVKSRFKHFGSAKVLKNLYRQHRLETGTCSDILEAGHFYEGTTVNEESKCNSDSVFYKQTEGHSMLSTVAIALHVAEEVIEEAISKAGTYSDSLYEACYLQDHKEELIEELATTIVQKITTKPTVKTEQVEASFERPQFMSNRSVTSAVSPKQNMLTFQRSHRRSYALWRSQSAFSLTNEATAQDPILTSSVFESILREPKGQIKKQKHKLSTFPSWKSVAQLNEPNKDFPPVLQSTDGNWVALQNAILPCPRMLAKPKSQVFKALEEESSIVSAYDEMGSDSEDNGDWNMTLNKLQQRPQELSNYFEAQHKAEWSYGNELYQLMTSPKGFTIETEYSDSEISPVDSLRETIASSLLGIHKEICNNKYREGKTELNEELDVNFNPQAISLNCSDSSENEKTYHDFEKTSRRWGKCNVLSEDLCKSKNYRKPPNNLGTYQVFDDLSKFDISCADQHQQSKARSMEERMKARLSELSIKIKNRETSEEETSESRTANENHKSGLASESNSKCLQEEFKKKCSAASLCNISTEVLKVINATEEFIAESTKLCDFPAETYERGNREFPLGTNLIQLDGQLTTLEENVYLTAGSVYGLESQLNDLEDAARKINTITAEAELADLEDQVATAAAQVHHAELQISDIERRISTLSVASLNVAPYVHLTRRCDHQTSQIHTIDTSRQQRRKLPTPPMKAKNMDASPVSSIRTLNKNFILQGSLTQRTKKEKNIIAKDLMVQEARNQEKTLYENAWMGVNNGGDDTSQHYGYK